MNTNETNLNEYGVLILSERDKKEFDYILEVRGVEWVNYAVKNLIGNRKPYVSNISKIAKLEIPENLPDKEKILSAEEVEQFLSKNLPQFRRKKKLD